MGCCGCGGVSAGAAQDVRGGDRDEGSDERAGEVGPQGVQVAADEVGAE